MPRVIVYRAGMLGDTIVAVPAIQALRRAYPDAVMALMTARTESGMWTDEVLRDFGWFDEVIAYDPSALADLRAMRRLRRQVRQFRADMVVHLSSERKSWLRLQRDRVFFALAGVPRFVGGVSDSVTWTGRLRTNDAVYDTEVDRLLRFAVAAGGAAGPPVFDLPVGPPERQRVDALLSQAGIDGTRPLVAVCPGSKQPAKRWPVERYRAVCQRLIDEHDAVMVVVGGVEEQAIGQQFTAEAPPGAWLNAAGQLSILESAELLRRCTLYVGNDTGAMHVAAAVGTRCVAVFAARCPGNSWHPYGEHHIVIRRRPPCRNCFLSDCVAQQSRCLTEISVDDVWRACTRVLVYR